MAFIIWRLTDGKPGHDSQSIGLCNAIDNIKKCERFDISVSSTITHYKNFLLKRFPAGKKLPDPNIIIGAGHTTHLPLLCATRARKGKSIVLMKPTLPLSFFDMCIIPEHDQVASKNNVILTRGAINPVTFNQNKLTNTGLFLIGGPSKHYSWNEESIVNQISRIIDNSPDTKWFVADSARTPETTLKKLVEPSQTELLSYKTTSSETIREMIFKTEKIWVSQDSVSMVYESLSSGAAVGLLNVEQKNENKISATINSLIKENQICSFEMWMDSKSLTFPSNKFNEADRCAMLLLERGVLD